VLFTVLVQPNVLFTVLVQPNVLFTVCLLQGECGIKEGGFIHAALSDELPEDREAPSVLGGGGGGGVHLSMTSPMVAAGPRGNSEGARERGFDRLLLSGFSPAEIQFLRGQYHARRGNQIATQEELYAAEEEWLEENQERGIMSEGVGGGGAGGLEFEEEDASEGTQADFVLGCIMGFVFGIIMLFWIWDRGIVRKQKLGILCGIGANFTMGMMRYQNREAVGGGAADGSSSIDPGMSQHAPASLSNLLFGSDVGVASNSTKP
jgi:hypothetical protein